MNYWFHHFLNYCLPIGLCGTGNTGLSKGQNFPAHMQYFWQRKEGLTNNDCLPISPSVSRREGPNNSARWSAARPLLTPGLALPLLMLAPVSPELGPLPLTTPYLARALPFHVPRPACCAAALARQSRIWWLRPNLERIHICHEHYIMRTHLLAEIENHNFIWNILLLNR